MGLDPDLREVSSGLTLSLGWPLFSSWWSPPGWGTQWEESWLGRAREWGVQAGRDWGRAFLVVGPVGVQTGWGLGTVPLTATLPSLPCRMWRR